MIPKLELVVVWDGGRDDPSNGGYLNVEFYPTRDAPARPAAQTLPRVACNAEIAKALHAPVRVRLRQPNNVEKKHAFQNCMTLLVQQLRQQPLTIAQISAVTGKKYWNVRHCLTLLKHQGILRSRPVSATHGRPTCAFWIEQL